LPGVWQIPSVLGGSDLVESVILRSWVAVDTKGNLTENCLQIFANVSPASLALPTTTNITVSCGTGTSPEDLIGEQDINGITITADQVSPGGISPSRVVCGWITNYGDQEIEACGNSKKIIRTWTWLDWCAHTPVLLGPFIQIIEIIDDEAPTLTSGPSAMVRSGCMADITLGSAVWTDACGEVAAYRTELVKYYDADNDDEITKSDIDDIRAAGDILLKNNSNGGSFANLPIGTYWVLYFAIDECGNETNRLYEELDPDGSVIPANVHITTLTVANCPIIAPLEPMDLSVIDPCSCDNPLNTTLNGTLLFHDILTIITTPDVPVILSNTDNNLLDATGNPIPIGEYILEFYTLPEISAYISVSNGADTENFITASCSCPNLIPTMSQWGLLIFSLLILNLGIIFIGRIELA